MRYLIGYLVLLIVFGVIDAAWLSTMGPLLYRPALKDILLAKVRLGPALAFYLMYPVGLLIFVVLPALRSNSIAKAFGMGLLFGAVAYATFDLTSFATLRNWTLQITLLDIAYGALVSGIAATASLWIVKLTSAWLSPPSL